MDAGIKTFDVQFIDGWRGLTNLEKEDALSKYINLEPPCMLPVIIGTPVEIILEFHSVLTRVAVELSKVTSFRASNFNPNDRTVDLEPLEHKALEISPTTHRVHAAYITDDRWVDGKLFSEIGGMLCLYVLEIALEDKDMDDNQRTMVNTGHIHED